MPVISFGAECSAFLKAATQAQQAARKLAAAALDAQQAVLGLSGGNFSRLISESDKAARAVGGIKTSTTKAADGASDALQKLAKKMDSVHTALQRMAAKDPGLQELADLAGEMSGRLSVVGAEANGAEEALANMAKATVAEQKKAVKALDEYSFKIGDVTIKTQSLSDTLAAGYYDLDRSMSRCFENLLTGAEVSFSGVRNAFMGMLADMANQAITRPITLSIITSLSNSLGLPSTGPASGTNSLFSGITNTINSTMSKWLPGLFGTGEGTGRTAFGLPSNTLSNAAINATTGGSYGGIALSGIPSAMKMLGSAVPYVGFALMGKSLMDSLTSKMSDSNIIKKSWNVIDKNSMQGGPGFFGWGDVLDLLRKDKVSQASMFVAPHGVMGGATARSFNKILGLSGGSGEKYGNVASLVLGDPLLGGLLGSLFGGGRKTRPSVYTKALDMGIGSDIDYTGKFMEGAWYDRAGSKEAEAVMPILGEAAKETAARIEALTAALPEEYRSQVEAELDKVTWSAGRGVEGMDKKNWNFQFYDEEQLKERLAAVTEDIEKAMTKAAEDALGRVDMSDMGLTFDTSTLEGLAKAAEALEAFNEVTDSIDKSLNPLSEYATIQKNVNAQVDEWKSQLTDLGFTEAKVAEIEAQRNTLLEKALEPMRTAFEQDMRIREAQLSGNKDLLASTQLTVQHEKELTSIRAKFGEDSAEYARVVNIQGQELAQLTAQLKEQVEAQLEAQRAQLAALRTSFAQDMSIRHAQLSGDADLIASIQLTIQHERELADIREKFGADSVQLAEMQYMQIAEAAQLAWQQQQTAAQKALQEQQAALQKQLQEQSRAAQEALSAATKAESEANAALSKAQSHLNAVRSAYLSALNKEASGLKTAIDAVSRAVEQLARTRRDLLADAATSTLGTADRYAFAGAELERTFAKAMSGDAEAMSELATLSSKYLDVSKEANADFSKYRKDFEKVQTMLAAVEAAGGMQNDTAQKQLDLLNAQIAAATEGTGQIVGSIKELEIAFVAALGDYNAAQEAARKAQEAADEARRKAEEAAQNAQNNSQNGSNGSQGGTTTVPKTWMQDVLDRKAAAMNRGETLGPGQTAGGWTADRVLQEIILQVGSFAEWYARYGKLEGFAKGGVASGWAIVGEQGPELVNFSQPGRVYTADDTAEMLKPSAFAMPDISDMAGSSGMSGTSGRFKSDALNAELLQEIRALRREVAELRAEQNRSQFRIADAAQRTARKLEQFDFDGLPGTREQ